MQTLHSDIDRAFSALHDRPRPYAEEMPPAAADAALNLAREVVEQILGRTPPPPALEGRRIAHTANITGALDFLGDKAFLDVNPLWRPTPEFDMAKWKAELPTLNRSAIHLELGSYTSWPDERVAEYVKRLGIGTFVRLDMNADYGPDIVANATALPFADESVDRVHANSLLEHVAYPHEIIREAFRVLRPGGIFVVAVPYHFVSHGCPHDYLRYTPQFFDQVCKDAGFEGVMSDGYGASGVFYTLHQFLKGCMATDDASRFLHVFSMALFAACQGLDNSILGGGAHVHHATRAIAVKPGAYSVSSSPPDWRSLLVCPATGLPVRRFVDTLVAADGLHRYEIVENRPHMFVETGFGDHSKARASSREALAEWSRGHPLMEAAE